MHIRSHTVYGYVIGVPDAIVIRMEIRKMPVADIEMGYEGDRLVSITVKPTTDDENGRLDFEELLYAARQIQEFARREYRLPMMSRSRTTSNAVDAVVAAHNKGPGVTDEYLARLSVAYEELAPQGRGVSTALADALGSKVPTVKGHLMRARREGFLTQAIEGKEGGEATPKALALVRDLTPNDSNADSKDAEIAQLKSQVETWKRLAGEFAEEADKTTKRKTARSTT